MDFIMASQTSHTQLRPWYVHKATYVILTMQLLLLLLYAVLFFFLADLLISLRSTDGSRGTILFIFVVCSKSFWPSWCLGGPGSFHEFAYDCWIYEVTFFSILIDFSLHVLGRNWILLVEKILLINKVGFYLRSMIISYALLHKGCGI
jgi:hypothetical protein